MYKRILLKLSGEALGNPFDNEILDDIARQVKEIVKLGVEVGIVVGGGNICRGRTFEKLGLDRRNSDYIGMTATVINAQMIEASLKKIGVKAKTLSTVKIQRVLDYSKKEANNLLSKKTVCVFGGGTGKPFYSTDTGSALRAKDIKAELILMAKNGVDGVYSADPKIDKNAIRFDELSFDDIINKQLAVIDLEAAKICKENNINAFIFDMSTTDNIIKAVKNEAVGTIIK